MRHLVILTLTATLAAAPACRSGGPPVEFPERAVIPVGAGSFQIDHVEATQRPGEVLELAVFIEVSLPQDARDRDNFETLFSIIGSPVVDSAGRSYLPVERTLQWLYAYERNGTVPFGSPEQAREEMARFRDAVARHSVPAEWRDFVSVYRVREHSKPIRLLVENPHPAGDQPRRITVRVW